MPADRGEPIASSTDQAPTSVRTKVIDYDARPRPKTNQWCVACQRDLKPSQARRYVYVTGDYQAVHPDDFARWTPRDKDFSWRLIGNACARKLGMEWTTDAPARPGVSPAPPNAT